jgi:hypothetical protein
MKNYFNYTIDQRINRKSHFSPLGGLMNRLIECTNKPDLFMNDFLLPSGRINLTGESVVKKTNYIPYKIIFKN